MTERKFYKTVIRVEVLSESPLPDTLSLGEIAAEIEYGDSSGKWVREPEVELNGAEAADALVAQDSDPEFFMLDKYGNDAQQPGE